jgi:prophage DNA circulation protein
MALGFTYEAEFAGISLDVISTQVNHGRMVIPHKFPKRDGADLEDMGREPWQATLELIFINRRASLADEFDYEDRFLEFKTAVGTGEPRQLVHPYEGSVICRVSGFTHRSTGDEGQPAIFASATFTEEISIPPVFAVGAGAQTRVGAQQVAATGEAAIAELEKFEFDTSLVSATIDAADDWERDPSLSTRSVQLQMASINNQLDAQLTEFNAIQDLEKHGIYKQYTILQHNLRKAAESFSSTTTRIITITIREPLPLKVIAARFYGANEAERRAQEMIELNPALGNPSLVARGVELRAYSANTESGRLVA